MPDRKPGSFTVFAHPVCNKSRGVAEPTAGGVTNRLLVPLAYTPRSGWGGPWGCKRRRQVTDLQGGINLQMRKRLPLFISGIFQSFPLGSHPEARRLFAFFISLSGLAATNDMYLGKSLGGAAERNLSVDEFIAAGIGAAQKKLGILLFIDSRLHSRTDEMIEL